MTEERELKIPFDDLTRICLPCECGTEIIINMDDKEPSSIDWDKKDFQCSVCSHRFDSQLKSALMNFRLWLYKVRASKQKVSFRVKRTFDE